MSDPCERTHGFATIEAIAAALREELGPTIEEQARAPRPGRGRPAHRASRVMAREVLRTSAAPGEDPAAPTSRALGRLARRRPEAEGLDRREIEHLLLPEPGGRDDRLASLILTAASEIEHPLRTRGPDHDPPAEPAP